MDYPFHNKITDIGYSLHFDLSFFFLYTIPLEKKRNKYIKVEMFC